MKTIEITKQEALVLASLAYAMSEDNGIVIPEVDKFFDETITELKEAAEKYGSMSVEDTNALVLKMFQKGIAND